MKYVLAFWGLFFCTFCQRSAWGQTRPLHDTLVSYATILEAGNEAWDSGNYQRAFRLYGQVPEGDTLHALALYRAVVVANNDSSLYRTGLALAHRSAALPFSLLHHNSLIQLANSYTLNGYADSADQIYRQLEALSPHGYLALLERGQVNLRLKRYPEAIYFLEAALMRNPYSGKIHQSLALAYLYQRRPSEAYLALITSLFFTAQPLSAQKSIVLLSGIANSNLDELSPPSKPAAASHPFWDETDELLLSRLPLNADYQFKSTMNEDPLVKVLHALMEKMPQPVAAADTSFAMQVYAPLFQQLYATGSFDGLVQYTFSGYGIKKIDQAAERNKKTIAAVREEVLAYFSSLFETGVRQASARAAAPLIRYRVPDEEEIVMTGNLRTTKTLKWAPGEVRIYNYGILVAAGPVDNAGEKTGTWKTYYKNGQLSGTTQLTAGKENGTTQLYSITGIRAKTARLRNDTSFYEEHYDASGRLNRIATQEFVSGKTIVRQIQFHPNGMPRDTAVYTDDQRNDGPMREWDAEGKLVEEGTFRKGSLEGAFRQWYPFTHMRKAEGSLVAGELEGVRTRFHPNGQPSTKATFRKGEQNGWEEEWNESGILQERSLYEDGQVRETQFMDDSGRVYERLVFEKGGMPQLLQRRDAAGNLHQEAAFRNRGSETLRLTHANGTPKAELPYTDGKADGTLRYFAPSGLLISEATFAAGEPQGWKVNYHPNGRVRSEHYRVTDKIGRYRRFSEAGLLEQESFLTLDNTAQGLSTTYSAFGKPVATWYRDKGEYEGVYMEQDPQGTPLYISHYADGLLLSQQLCDTTGRAWHEERFPQGNGILLFAGLNHQVLGRDTLVGGRREGIQRSHYAPGLPLRKALYKNGLIEGELLSWHPNGQKAMQDTERHSSTEGIRRTWDEAGNLTSEATYAADEQTGPEWRYSGGVLRSFRSYKEDLLDGPYFFMNGTADTLARLDYVEGHLLRKQVRDSLGRWQAPQAVKEGNADVYTYYPQGGKAVDFHYRHNVLEGTQRSWYPNGKMAEQMDFKSGCWEGPLERFYPDGSPYLRSRFEKDHHEGEELTWYPNGKICARITFLKGMRHGSATYYDKDEKKSPVTIEYRYDHIVSQR